MKALFIGVGSIGKRHIKNFYAECVKRGIMPEIDVLRRQVGELPEEIDNIVSKQTTIIEQCYDVIFVTNPTNLHYDALVKAASKAAFFFIEKPIFEICDYDLEALGINEGNSYVAAPMRHTVLYKKFKNLISEKRVFSARIVCSSYLPEWRPEIDYRKNYSAIKEMGGGVALDLIHEMDYMADLFGIPRKVNKFGGTYSNLEISSDDLGVYVMEYPEMLCEVHLDYFGREYRRTCEVFTEEGTYVADFGKEIIQFPCGSIENCADIKDGEYVHEMEYFIDFVMGSNTIFNSPQHALDVLRIAIGGR